MKQFFRDLFVNTREFFTGIKNGENRKKLAIIIAVLAVVIIAVVVSVYAVNESKEPQYDPETMAQMYAENTVNKDYYAALSQTVFSKVGVEDFIDSQYLSEYESGSVSSKAEKRAVADISDVMAEELESYFAMHGFDDFDGFFKWFFKDTATKTVTYTDVSKVNKDLLMAILMESLDTYRMAEKNNLENSAEIEVVKTDEIEFADKDVDQYIKHKSKKALAILDACSISKAKKIKAVKKYVYTVKADGFGVNTINVYMIKIGAEWYVDNTALAY